MSNNIFNTIWLACSFLVLFGIAEFLYHKIKVKADYTRNLVHVGTGFLTFLFPVLLNNHWWVLLLCSSFAGLLLISLKLNLLKSINAIGRQSVGSLAFPVVVYSCYLVSEYLDNERAYFYLPILILAVCDPLAAIFGKRWPVGIYTIDKEKKSLLGSMAFFIGSYLLITIYTTFFLDTIVISPLLAIALALAATISEACSWKGYDNLMIPLSIVMGLFLLQNYC